MVCFGTDRQFLFSCLNYQPALYCGGLWGVEEAKRAGTTQPNQPTRYDRKASRESKLAMKLLVRRSILSGAKCPIPCVSFKRCFCLNESGVLETCSLFVFNIFDARRDGSECDRSLAERPHFICMYNFLLPMSIFGAIIFGVEIIWTQSYTQTRSYLDVEILVYPHFFSTTIFLGTFLIGFTFTPTFFQSPFF